MKKTIYTLLLLPLAIFSLGSCKPLEEGYGIENPEQYSRIYIAASYNGRIDKEVEAPRQDTIVINANYSGVVSLKNDVTVNLTTDMSLVSSYNSANNTSFKALPQKTFSLDPASTKILAGLSTSSDPALLLIKTIAFEDDDAYLLPIKISSVSDPSLVINNDLSVLYVGIRCSATAMYITLNPLVDFIVDSNENW